MNNYPYPVLTESNSSYKENINFSIVCEKHTIEQDDVKFDISFNLNSDYLLSLLEENKAKAILNISTSIINKSYYVDSLNEKYIATLPIGDIKANDTINITCVIVADNAFDIQSNDEFDELYGQDYLFTVRRGDKLAVSNKERLSFYTEDNNFIRFKSSPDVEIGYKVRLSSENFIEVLVKEEFTKAYAIVSRKRKISMILESNIVYEVLVYTILQIAQDYYEYSKKPWFDSLSRMFDECGENIDEFIEMITSDNKLNIESVYSIVHKLTNDQIVDSVIKTSEKIKSESDGDNY